MNECLAVYWRFQSTRLNWESAPDAVQASIFKEKRGYFVCFVAGVALLNKTSISHFQAIDGLIFISAKDDAYGFSPVLKKMQLNN